MLRIIYDVDDKKTNVLNSLFSDALIKNRENIKDLELFLSYDEMDKVNEWEDNLDQYPFIEVTLRRNGVAYSVRTYSRVSALKEMERREWRLERQKLDKETRIKVYNRCKGLCMMCGKTLNYNEAAVDHIMPVSKGGKTEINNL